MIKNLTAIFEGYGRVSNFNYLNYEKDPSPNVLVLGSYVNHKGTNLVCGINIKGLSAGELKQLRVALPQILSWPKQPGKTRSKPRRLNGPNGRYWTGRNLLPQLFKSRYRSYNSSQIQGAENDTLTFEKSSDEDQKRAIELANADGYPIDSLDDFGEGDESLKIEYLGKAAIEKELAAAAKKKPKAKPMPSSYPPVPPVPPAVPPTTPPLAPPPGPGGMAPITPEQAVPGGAPPPPVPDMGATPAPMAPKPPAAPLTSPGRRGAKHLPGHQAPQKPPSTASGAGEGKPALPLPPSSRQRRERGASKAIDNLEQRKFEQGKEQDKAGEDLGETEI